MGDLTQIDSVAGVKIYSVAGEPRSFIYKAGMTIDADGAYDPACYGPDNSGQDYTANGGTPGDYWWGGPVDSNGWPIVQKIYEPAPGMYVSGTALINPAFDEDSQYRYVDSNSIPFMVLPGSHSNGAKCGDVCLCYNTQTGDNCYGIYADIGPSSKIGEASIRMAQALKIHSDPKKGGISSKIVVYLVFLGSIGKWAPPDQWFLIADDLVRKWGGLERLKTLLPNL